MKAFGFLSFGHYGHGRGPGDPDAGQALKEAVEIAVGADEIGVNGAYWRVHHYARQAAAPIPLLSAAGARTQRIEVGTGVIDMRYENPLYLAEEVAALDLLTDQRIAIGISRGSPEQARRGWESFGYTGGTDPRGADVAHATPLSSSTPSGVSRKRTSTPAAPWRPARAPACASSRTPPEWAAACGGAPVHGRPPSGPPARA